MFWTSCKERLHSGTLSEHETDQYDLSDFKTSLKASWEIKNLKAEVWTSVCES